MEMKKLLESYMKVTDNAVRHLQYINLIEASAHMTNREKIEKEITDEINKEIVASFSRMKMEPKTLKIPVYNRRMEKIGVRSYSLGENEMRALEYLHKKFSTLSRIDGDKKGNSDGLSILFGPPQSGKSSNTCAYAMREILLGKNVILMTMNHNDNNNQFRENFESLQANVMKAGKEYGFVFPNTIVVNCKLNNEREVERALKGSGNIVFSNYNKQQTRRLITFCEEKDSNPFVIILDESDTSVKSNPDKEAGRDINLRLLKEMATRMVGVTATPTAHWLGNSEQIMASQAITISIEDDYHGLDDPKIQFFEMKGIVKYQDTFYEEEIFIPPEWFDTAIDHFFEKKPRSCGDPHSMLICTTTYQLNHHSQQEWLTDRAPNSPSVVYNGRGYRLYFPLHEDDLSHWRIGLYVYEDGYHTWSHTTVTFRVFMSRVRGLYELYECQDEPFFTIAGIKADRAISFTDSEHASRLTGIIYMAGTTVDGTTAQQKICRIGGRWNDEKDDDVRFIYTTKKIYNRAKKTYLLNLEMMEKIDDRMENERLNQNVLENVGDALAHIKVDKMSVPRGRMCKQFTVSEQKQMVNVASLDRVVSGQVYQVIQDSLSNAEKDTFNLLLIAYGEGHKSGWIKRNKIAKKMQDIHTQKMAYSKLQKVFQKIKKVDNVLSEGVYCKKIRGLWRYKVVS
jgi:hypothetical protein